jgi:hypothetical protein
MRKQVEAWRRTELMHVTVKVLIWEAFVGSSRANRDRIHCAKSTGPGRNQPV